MKPIKPNFTAGFFAESDSRAVPRVAQCLAILLFAVAALVSQKRAFDPDEFLHLHVAWSISKGLIPFRDYFDHYTPLFRVLLAPAFEIFKVDTDTGDALASLFLLRGISWSISGLILLFTFWLAKLWKNASVGYVAILFLLCTEAYWNTTLEIRPDTLSTVFFLLYLIMVALAVQPRRDEYTKKWLFVWSGLFLAFGFLTIQKLVYAFPGLAVGTCWYMMRSSDRAARRLRLTHIAYQLGAFCTPLLLTGIYFYSHGALTQFIHYNFFLYLGVAGFSPHKYIMTLLYQNPLFCLFGGAGLVWATAQAFRRAIFTPDIIIIPATISLLVGLFLIPVPHFQYFVFFLPLVALFAAYLLVQSITELAEICQRPFLWRQVSIITASSIAVLTALILLAKGAPSPWPPFLVVGYWFGLYSVTIGLALTRGPSVALALFLAVMSVGSLRRLQTAITSPAPSPQLEEISYVIRNTAPSDTIMDGYQGSGLYRPHAYYFWFLPYNERKALSENDRQLLLEGLNSGSIAPKLILFDKHLRDISPTITQFFENYYEPTNVGVIWKRKAAVNAQLVPQEARTTAN